MMLKIAVLEKIQINSIFIVRLIPLKRHNVMGRKSIISILLLMFLCGGCSVFGVRSSYETLQYEVVSKTEGFEIRKYPKRLVAEVSGVADRNKAFIKLFNYIQGENFSEEKVSMTIPVQLHEQSQGKEAVIPMTIPVDVEEGVTMRFFLPRSFTAETAPRAKDSDIRLRELPSQYHASLEYSGSTNREKFEEKKALLLDFISHSGWELVGPVTQYVYDGPFTLPFFRRNEAIAPVTMLDE